MGIAIHLEARSVSMAASADGYPARVKLMFRKCEADLRNTAIETKIQNGLYAHQSREEIIESVAAHWPLLRELNFMKGRELRDSLKAMNRGLQQIGFKPVTFDELVTGRYL